ncbi:hypothetical protein D3C73_1104430 [compost metagenome]
MQHARNLLHLQGGIQQQMLRFCHFDPVHILMQRITAAAADQAAQGGHGHMVLRGDPLQIRLLINAGIQILADLRQRLMLPGWRMFSADERAFEQHSLQPQRSPVCILGGASVHKAQNLLEGSYEPVQPAGQQYGIT